MKCYRVWFCDGSAVLVDAENETTARRIIEAGIKHGLYWGIIDYFECLTEIKAT